MEIANGKLITSYTANDITKEGATRISVSLYLSFYVTSRLQRDIYVYLRVVFEEQNIDQHNSPRLYVTQLRGLCVAQFPI